MCVRKEFIKEEGRIIIIIEVEEEEQGRNDNYDK